MEKREIPVGVFHFDCFWMQGFQWCDFEFDVEFFPDSMRTQISRFWEDSEIPRVQASLLLNSILDPQHGSTDHGILNRSILQLRLC